MDYNAYIAYITTDPQYYGDCTPEEATLIALDLERMVKDRFKGIVTNVTEGWTRTKVDGPDHDTVSDIDQWIDQHWTEACKL